MAADMTDIMQAIYKRYSEFVGPVDAFTLTGGRMYRGMAPAGGSDSDFPYIVITQTGGIINETFGDGALEDIAIQMSVFGKFDNDISPTSKIMKSLISVFNWATLYIPSDASSVRMRRDGVQQEIVEDKDAVHIFQDWLVEQTVPKGGNE